MLANRAAVLLFLAACADQQTSAPPPREPEGATNIQPVSVNTPQSVVDALAGAACDREQRCGRIGSGRSYLSKGNCLDDQAGRRRSDLQNAHCPNGIDSAKVDSCLSTIRAERCDDLIDAIGRLAECRVGALCR